VELTSKIQTSYLCTIAPLITITRALNEQRCEMRQLAIGASAYMSGKISYAITCPGASMQSSDLVHPI
jgi:hypothetical protein